MKRLEKLGDSITEEDLLKVNHYLAQVKSKYGDGSILPYIDYRYTMIHAHADIMVRSMSGMRGTSSGFTQWTEHQPNQTAAQQTSTSNVQPTVNTTLQTPKPTTDRTTDLIKKLENSQISKDKLGTFVSADTPQKRLEILEDIHSDIQTDIEVSSEYEPVSSDDKKMKQEAMEILNNQLTAVENEIAEIKKEIGTEEKPKKTKTINENRMNTANLQALKHSLERKESGLGHENEGLKDKSDEPQETTINLHKFNKVENEEVNQKLLNFENYYNKVTDINYNKDLTYQEVMDNAVFIEHCLPYLDQNNKNVFIELVDYLFDISIKDSDLFKGKLEIFTLVDGMRNFAKAYLSSVEKDIKEFQNLTPTEAHKKYTREQLEDKRFEYRTTPKNKQDEKGMYELKEEMGIDNYNLFTAEAVKISDKISKILRTYENKNKVTKEYLPTKYYTAEKTKTLSKALYMNEKALDFALNLLSRFTDKRGWAWRRWEKYRPFSNVASKNPVMPIETARKLNTANLNNYYNKIKGIGFYITNDTRKMFSYDDKKMIREHQEQLLKEIKKRGKPIDNNQPNNKEVTNEDKQRIHQQNLGTSESYTASQPRGKELDTGTKTTETRTGKTVENTQPNKQKTEPTTKRTDDVVRQTGTSVDDASVSSLLSKPDTKNITSEFDKIFSEYTKLNQEFDNSMQKNFDKEELNSQEIELETEIKRVKNKLLSALDDDNTRKKVDEYIKHLQDNLQQIEVIQERKFNEYVAETDEAKAKIKEQGLVILDRKISDIKTQIDL